MKRIAILGFNIFAKGGTSRSNINLLEEFGREGYQITFFNFSQFTRSDVRRLRHENQCAKDVNFKYVKELENKLDYDYFFITRESFFCVAPYIRANSQAMIIGEIHAPLALIEENDIQDFLEFFSCVRVSTPSIRAEIKRRFNYERVYAQTVSLEHISNDLEREVKSPVTINEDGVVNLIVRARFDQVKDIPAAIKLMDYMVNFLKHSEFRLYITGYGPAKTLLSNLVRYYNLEEYVLFNADVPDNHVYISTGFYETFGYSILEEFAEGHPVIMYPGNDKVLYENFKNFKDCLWIEKNPEKDFPKILEFVNSKRQKQDIIHNLELVKQLKSDYVAKFEKNTDVYKSEVGPIDGKSDVSYEDMWTLLQKHTKFDGMRKFRRLYYKVRKVPAIGALIKQDWIRVPAMKFLSTFTGETPDFTSEEPISTNKFFIESFHGNNFSGDPKYFALAIKQQIPNAEIFVSSTNQLVDMEILSFGMIPLRTGGLKYVEKFQECKYVFINGNSLDKAGKREGQVFIETWHGFPMKQMVNDLADEDQRNKESEAFAPRMQKWDFLTTSSAYNVELLSSAFKLEDNSDLNVLNHGTPKNEYLQKNVDNEVEKARIFEKYFNRPFDSSKKIVLFCPTWRKGNRNDVSEIDLEEVINSLPDDYLLIVKLHPLEGRLRRKYADLDPRIFCFYNELVDIQELYVLSDLLISDYSSAIFDFSLLNKPIIVMQQDGEEYSQKIGWYFDIEKECGLVAKDYSTNELVDAIVNVPNTQAASNLIKEKLLTNEHIGSTNENLKIIFSH